MPVRVIAVEFGVFDYVIIRRDGQRAPLYFQELVLSSARSIYARCRRYATYFLQLLQRWRYLVLFTLLTIQKP